MRRGLLPPVSFYASRGGVVCDNNVCVAAALSFPFLSSVTGISAEEEGDNVAWLRYFGPTSKSLSSSAVEQVPL